ncbi:hypothetical protein CODIS_41830 [Candidatus Thiodiazotropha endolucinida]|uniref:Uncharacterized protein n=1 Tax=Candidatus Thiodiazotropha endolucinida TaxID=1655433 RepID=A0A7Z1AE21_9GAMM|nr:hypothetical protein CODIS_41830 [Candidatus Thiodiazotropha endolucinida]
MDITIKINHYRGIIDRSDIDIDSTEIDRATTGTGVAVIGHIDLDSVGVITAGIRRTVQIGDVARGIEVVVQIGQRAGQCSGRACTADRDTGTCRRSQVATGAGGQGHGQCARSGIDVSEINRRQIDITQYVFSHRDITRQ